MQWLPDDQRAVSGGEAPSDIEAASPLRLPRAEENERPRVLVANDNADMRDYLCRLLETRYVVEAVPDGEAALERIRSSPPDLVLSDVMMPRLDGLGLLRTLRSGEDSRIIPLVLLSARAGEESRIEALGAGANDYLIKPFSARELLARIDSQLEIARVRREAEETLRENAERLRESNAKLGRSEEALREADCRKNEFLAMLAHELRNPLAPIRNAAQVLRLIGTEEPNLKWSTEIIERQVKRALRHVPSWAATRRWQHTSTMELRHPVPEPKDYRRIHMPCEGRLTRMIYVPGELFSVNPITARDVPGLFARNERVVCVFETAYGAFVNELVGATIVGSVATVWHGVVNPPRQPTDAANGATTTRSVVLKRGRKSGRFLLGSTIVMLKNVVTFMPDWAPSRPVRLGEPMATVGLDERPM